MVRPDTKSSRGSTAGAATATARAKAPKLPFTEVTPEFWLNADPFDPKSKLAPYESRHATGKKLRRKIPFRSIGEWSPAKDRPDPVEIIRAANKDRQQEYVPLGMERMGASPFSFFRGAAAIMASDLARQGVSTGIPVVMCGDAHLSNFGFYSTPQREVVFDINDFDEAVIGPWEWDLKRLAASVSIAGRENGLDKRERKHAVAMSVRGYCGIAERHESEGILETWYKHTYPEQILNSGIVAEAFDLKPKTHQKVIDVWLKAIAKAKRTTNESLLTKIVEEDERERLGFAFDPPVLSKVSSATKKQVVDSLTEYAETLPRERKFMFKRYHVVDVAHRVVGVGSVGVRAYLIFLLGNGPSDALFLQVKEATEPAHAAYLPFRLLERHEGWRVVSGQRVLQASTDFMLGWTTIDGRPFYVRQMKNMKGAVPVEQLTGPGLGLYAFGCGAILARGHARTGDIAKISGYCGRWPRLGRILANFAEDYADQNEKDHKAFVKAIFGKKTGNNSNGQGGKTK
jgi:uncharacterized protein (DUF2252 family)